MTDDIGVGLIGTGGVARLHARAVQAVPGLRLVGAWSRSSTNVDTFSAEVETRGYGSIEALLDDPAVAVISICTPRQDHVQPAIKALRAGKHVVVEKPIADTLGEIDDLEREAERAGRVCMPCHNYIYAPQIRRAKQLIEAGKLGRIGSFWLVYNQRHDADIGVPGFILRELCVHHAYAVLFLLGRPAQVVAVTGNVHFDDPAADDQVMIVCKMSDGAIANLWGSNATDDRTSDPWTVVYKVLGSDGGFTYTWDDVYFGEAKQPGWDKPAYSDSFVHVYEHLANRVLRQGEPPLSTLRDARDALCLLEAAEKSLSGSAVVDYG